MQPIQDVQPFLDASLLASTLEVRYAWAGHGAPVLLLVGVFEADDLRFALGRSLAATFRVIVPRLAGVGFGRAEPAGGPEPVSLQSCLHVLLEGLGLERVCILADDHFAAAALGFALMDPDRVDRLVLLQSDGAAPEPTDGFVESFHRPGGPLPVLCQPCDFRNAPDGLASSPLVGRMARFLSGADAAGDGRGTG